MGGFAHGAEPGHGEEFPSTRWELVQRLGDRRDPEADAALEWLCRSYWHPIYAYIRRRGHPADRACDLTQDFFAAIIARDGFPTLEPGLGRFRAYLLICCKHFLSNSRAHDAAIKRGGGRAHLSIDARDAEGRYLSEPIDDVTPEEGFDRLWALSLLDAAAESLRREYEEKGRLSLFEPLRSVLFQEVDARPHAEIAEALGMSADAVKKAAQRLRDRYREVLRAEVARTVDDPSLVGDELRDLLACVGRRGGGPR